METWLAVQTFRVLDRRVSLEGDPKVKADEAGDEGERRDQFEVVADSHP